MVAVRGRVVVFVVFAVTFCTVTRGDGVLAIGVPCPEPGVLMAFCPGTSREKLELPLGDSRLKVEPL